MRIAHNIMAMNTHRSYTLNNEKVASSAEKLSSGFRINRAADDAAGLAISEKMRAQIRGINMAARNGQDASSLIQTAEGALQEVHAMLQRMNELAVQSATGTNETFDRTQIHKEFEQLKREINDISEQTTFNNMKLLDGSLSNNGIQRSAQTSGIFPELAETRGSSAITTVVSGGAPQPGVQGSASFLISEVFTAGDTGPISFTIDDQAVSYTVISGDGVNEIAAGLQANLQAQIGYEEYTVTAVGAEFYVKTGDGDDAPTADMLIDDLVGTGGAVSSPTLGTPSPAKAPTSGSVSVNDVTFTNGIKVGDTVSFNGKIYEFVKAGEAASGSNFAVDIDEDVDIAIGNLATAITDAAKGNEGATYTVDAIAGGKLKVTQKAIGVGDVQMTMQAATNKNTTVEFDSVKLRTGDIVTLDVTDVEGNTETVSYTHNEGGTMDNIATSLAGGAAGGVRKGNTIFFENATVKVSFKGADQDVGERMRIQVGALEGEQLNIEIKAMNSAGLGLDEANIATQDLAGSAITATRDAIATVSDQRALLGAMQNRMTYKINNIKVSAENLQAAEGRIRDIDIAQEMSEFTKNNILTQAATAMLAQANAAPQNVLSLLQ